MTNQDHFYWSRANRLGTHWRIPSLVVFLGYAILGTAVLSACELQEPTPAPISGGESEPGFVDLVLSYSENGTPITCDTTVTDLCGVRSGPCAQHEIMGAPDQVTFELQGQSTIEFGLLCHPVLDRADQNAPRNDLTIWATIASGSAIVSVSEDGAVFTVLQNLNSNDQSFDLSEQNIPLARFIRITGATSATSIAIDAVEALP